MDRAVSSIDYRKGPYYADVGDFSSAGAAEIHYATSLAHSIGSVTLGEHDYKRALLAGSPNVGGGTLLYGIELMGQDGPWDNPENFRKLNTVLRYSRGDKTDGFAITGPQRLVGGRVETSGDHRIAMAFAVAALVAEGTTEIIDAECATVSFPEFYESLTMLTGPGTVEPVSLDGSNRT